MQNAKLLLNTRIRMYYRTIKKPQHKRLYYPLEVKSYDLDQKIRQLYSTYQYITVFVPKQ